MILKVSDVLPLLSCTSAPAGSYVVSVQGEPPVISPTRLCGYIFS